MIIGTSRSLEQLVNFLVNFKLEHFILGSLFIHQAHKVHLFAMRDKLGRYLRYHLMSSNVSNHVKTEEDH